MRIAARALHVFDQPGRVAHGLLIIGRNPEKRLQEKQSQSKRKIDENLFEIFVKEGVYKQYAKKYLGENQLDEVDETAVLS